MRTFRFAAIALLVSVFLAAGISAQDLITVGNGKNLIREIKEIGVPSGEIVLNIISSTGTGGLWSSPSTWVGGVIPGNGDNVIIAGGATVIVDTTAIAGAVTVGDGGSPAVLTFDPSSARSLNVSGNVIIAGAADTLAAPGTGTVTSHVLSVGGNLTNNGILDLSTNSNQAGAELFFTGAASNTFGGGGSVTDIRKITMNKGSSSDSILDLTVSNFTVQGSTSDSAASAFLALTNGTFKVSGTFSGNHRTTIAVLVSPEVWKSKVPQTAGIWLNNPNYTVTAQNASLTMSGLFRISAGTFNVGRDWWSDSFIIDSTAPHPVVKIEGGNLNVITRVRNDGGNNPYTYDQSGGTLTACMDPAFDSQCFYLPANLATSTNVISMTGGEIVLQNGKPTSGATLPDFFITGSETQQAGMTGTTLRFGNASTVNAGFFKAQGIMPNLAIDSTVAPQTLVLTPQTSTYVRNVNIGANSTLNASNMALRLNGNSLVNNGNMNITIGSMVVRGTGTDADVVFSGSGAVTGVGLGLNANVHSLTLGASMSSLQVRQIDVDTTSVINASKLTLGGGFGDMTSPVMIIRKNASFDSTPSFDSGTPQIINYWGPGTYNSGPEINPSRLLKEFTVNGSGVINGGDLTINGNFGVTSGVTMASGKLIHLSGTANNSSVYSNGYINGAIVRRFSAPGWYTFATGQNGRALASVQVTSIGANPTDITVQSFNTAMPGMPSGMTALRHWKVESTANASANPVTFFYNQADVQGNEGKYRIWHRFPNGTLTLCSKETFDPGNNMITCKGSSNIAGEWGISEFDDPGPVFIAGRITEFNGNPIRNAFVTLSAEGRTPVTIQTGSLGSYIFNNLEAGLVYTITASAKRYRFATMEQQITPLGNLANIDFAANAPE